MFGQHSRSLALAFLNYLNDLMPGEWLYCSVSHCWLTAHYVVRALAGTVPQMTTQYTAVYTAVCCVLRVSVLGAHSL